MLDGTDSHIQPPKNPLTVAINGAVMDFYFNHFMGQNMPDGVGWIVTSEYRSPEHNKKVGGVSNSSHVHNLAKDVVLTDSTTGNKLGAARQSEVFNQFIKPKWQGFALDEKDHIHLNVSRRIGQVSAIAALGVIGILGFNLYSKFKKGK